MQNSDLGGSSTGQVLNSQDPQTQSGISNFTPSDGTSFQSSASPDVLNQPQTSSLSVTQTGVPNTAATVKPSSSWGSILIALGIIVVGIVLFIAVYRYAKRLGRIPFSEEDEEANSPFLIPEEPEVEAASKPAASRSAEAKAPVKPARNKAAAKAKKPRKKGAGARRRRK